MNDYEARLDRILYAYDDFDSNLRDFIKEDVVKLLDLNDYKRVWKLTETSLNRINENLGYDSSLNYNRSLNAIVKKVLPGLTCSEVRSSVYDYLYNIISDSYNESYLENFVEFFFNNFKREDELLRKNDLIWDILKHHDLLSQSKWVIRKVSVMRDLNKSDSEIDNFRRQYFYLNEIKQAFIDEAVENEDYDGAIKMLNEFRKDASVLTRHKYTVQLKNLYKNMGNTGFYEIELYRLLFDFDDVDFENYLEYKEFFRDNWLEEREEVFKRHLDNESFLNECYVEEKLYDRLIDNLDDVYSLNRYRDVLVDKYSNVLLEKYRVIVMEMAQKLGKRSYYRKIVKILNDMLKIPDSDEFVRQTVNDIHEKFPKRKALLEEIDSVLISCS